jgi:hypothetical protein
MGDYTMPKKSKKRDIFGMTDEDWDYFEYLMNMQYDVKTKSRAIINFKELIELESEYFSSNFVEDLKWDYLEKYQVFSNLKGYEKMWALARSCYPIE